MLKYVLATLVKFQRGLGRKGSDQGEMSRREQIFCGVMELKADSCILQSSSGGKTRAGWWTVLLLIEKMWQYSEELWLTDLE